MSGSGIPIPADAELAVLARHETALGGGRPLFRRSGPLHTARTGDGEDFVGFRPYEAGDDLRAVDWRASARAGKILARARSENAATRWYVLLDASGSMQATAGAGTSRWHVAVQMAAAISALISRADHRVGLVLFDRDVRRHVPSGSGRRHLETVFRELRTAAPPGGGPASVTTAVGRLARPSSSVLISDCLWPRGPGPALRACASLGGVVHVIRVASAADTRLGPGRTPRALLDAETAERLAVNEPANLLEDGARAALRRLEEELRRACRESNAVFSIANAETGWKTGLISHLRSGAGVRA